MKKVLGYSIIARNRRLAGRWNMLEKIVELTNEYIESMPKKERKKYGLKAARRAPQFSKR